MLTYGNKHFTLEHCATINENQCFLNISQEYALQAGGYPVGMFAICDRFTNERLKKNPKVSKLA